MCDNSNYFENDIFVKNNIYYKTLKISERFQLKNLNENELLHLLFLWPFVDHPILKYIDSDLYKISKDFLLENEEYFFSCITEIGDSVSKAFISFSSFLNEFSDEEKGDFLDANWIINIEKKYIPDYLRIIEFVFDKIINVYLLILNQLFDKNYNINANLDMKINILKSCRLGKLVEYCDIFMRNSIAHGNVSYSLQEIVFEKGNKKKSLFLSDYLKYHDGLNNTCSSIFFSVFCLFVNRCQEILDKKISIPIGFIHSFLTSLLEHDGLRYKYCFESLIADNKKQIILEVEIKSRSRGTQLLEAFKYVYFLNKYFIHEYDRVAVNFDCRFSVKAAVFIDVNKFNENILTNNFYNLYKSVDGDLLFYSEPDIFGRLSYWCSVIKSLFFYSKVQCDNILEEKGIEKFEKKYFIKKIEDRSSKIDGRLYLHIILIKDIKSYLENIELFIKFLESIVKKNKHCQKLKDGNFNGKTRFRKPSYIWGTLYNQDLRFRELDDIARKICDFEWINEKRINTPLLIKNEKPHRGIRVRFYDSSKT